MHSGGDFCKRNHGNEDDDIEGLVGKWAGPSGTARLGQPVIKPEQAPELQPLAKISLISMGSHGSRIRY